MPWSWFSEACLNIHVVYGCIRAASARHLARSSLEHVQKMKDEINFQPRMLSLDVVGSHGYASLLKAAALSSGAVMSHSPGCWLLHARSPFSPRCELWCSRNQSIVQRRGHSTLAFGVPRPWGTGLTAGARRARAGTLWFECTRLGTPVLHSACRTTQRPRGRSVRCQAGPRGRRSRPEEG